MVDKILTKKTNYNESLAKINELQTQIEVDKDISELEIKLKFKIKYFFMKKMKKYQHFLLI